MALRFKTDAKTMIRCAEVLSVDRRDSDNEVEVWYYLGRRESAYNDFEMPLHNRRLVPEWYGHADGMVYLAPTQKQIASGSLRKRKLVVLRSEVGILLAPKWTLQTGGKVAERSLTSRDSTVAKVVRARYG